MTTPSAITLAPAMEGVTTLLFDLMGTVTDWRTSLSASIASHLKEIQDLDADKFAHDWRNGFFRTAHAIAADGKTDALDDIDAIHATVLDELLAEVRGGTQINQESRWELVQAWHRQQAWPDSVKGLAQLREKYTVAVLANGTTRFQIDVTKCAGLQFDTLFSSQLLGSVKPRPEMYVKAMGLLAVKPENCAMIAAHFYDLQAASACGMKSVYIDRSTEDIGIDRNEIRKFVDIFVDEGGLLSLT